MTPIMSSGETSRVKDFERVGSAVMRPRRSRLGKPCVEESCTWFGTIATSAVPPAEFAMVSTRRVRA